MSRLALLLFVLGVGRLAWPGDVPFVNDEALLIGRALDLNEAGVVATTGLLGTRGAHYGPAPLWFYQIALAATSDLVWVAAARTVLVTAVTGSALVLLAGALRPIVSPALGAFAFLSPWLWFYSRDLWDNSFSIPLSALLVASYAAYLRQDRVRHLALAGLSGAMCFLTHLMTLPLVGAVGIHFLATRGKELGDARFAARVGAIGLGCVALSLPYVITLGSGSAAGLRLLPAPTSILFALDGVRTLTPVGIDYFMGALGPGAFPTVLLIVSALTYAASVVGLVAWGRDAAAGTPGLRRDFGRLLVLALLLFVLLANGLRLREHPHYYNGVWVVFLCLWWRGMTELMGRRSWRLVFGAQTVAMTALLVAVPVTVHRSGGTRALHYGPTLSNQIEVARELEQGGLAVLQPSEVEPVRLFPHALEVLRQLERSSRASRSGTEGASPREGERDGTRTLAEIRWADPDGLGGTIELAEVSGAPDP